MNKQTHIDADGKVRLTQQSIWNKKNTLEDFAVGNQVNVKRLPNDLFNHDFTGYVKEVNAEYIIVEDQDGICWDCEPTQLSHSSDEIMHGK